MSALLSFVTIKTEKATAAHNLIHHTGAILNYHHALMIRALKKWRIRYA
jgi:hypothetical protein